MNIAWVFGPERDYIPMALSKFIIIFVATLSTGIYVGVSYVRGNLPRVTDEHVRAAILVCEQNSGLKAIDLSRTAHCANGAMFSAETALETAEKLRKNDMMASVANEAAWGNLGE
jgi:hypothetical protein